MLKHICTVAKSRVAKSRVAKCRRTVQLRLTHFFFEKKTHTYSKIEKFAIFRWAGNGQCEVHSECFTVNSALIGTFRVLSFLHSVDCTGRKAFGCIMNFEWIMNSVSSVSWEFTKPESTAVVTNTYSKAFRLCMYRCVHTGNISDPLCKDVPLWRSHYRNKKWVVDW